MTPSLAPVRVNDQQSRTNQTEVAGVVRIGSLEDLRAALRLAAERDLPVTVCGGRHAMGGQPFGRGAVLLDSAGLDEVHDLDTDAGTVTAGAGIFWPALMRRLEELQPDDPHPWGIRQKQTGVDEVSLGGSLGCNAHGRGLAMAPIVGDVESFTLVDADGEVHRCSRQENAALFGLAIGGYGCFGVILDVTLRLQRRFTVERRVEAIEVKTVIQRVAEHRARGAVYGDCQYATHLDDPPGHHSGIVSCYHRVDGEPDSPDPSLSLSRERWTELVKLARRDKPEAFRVYREHYLRTDGRRYASDRHQLSPRFSDYLAAVNDGESGKPRADEAVPEETPGTTSGDGGPLRTEMITEVSCDPDALVGLLSTCRADFIEPGVDMTYGTIRFIEPDTETFLPWARRRSACVVVNLHVVHTPKGLARVRADFRRILDRVLEVGGSFYLTYHRWATRAQLDAAYPELPAFLAEQRHRDPAGRFSSDWLRHLQTLYPDA